MQGKSKVIVLNGEEGLECGVHVVVCRSYMKPLKGGSPFAAEPTT